MTLLSPYLIIGPCAAENREQVFATAEAISNILSASNTGAEGLFLRAQPKVYFRAGAWKPRTQPGHFEGVGEEALHWLQEVKQNLGLAIATEVATPEHLRLALQHDIDAVWIGARTTTNPFLVQQLADEIATQKPSHLVVFVKNPLSPDVNLWQGAIERFAKTISEANVAAIHRGFQTEIHTDMRNAAGWSVAFELKRRMPSLSLLLDPSHMAGAKEMISPLSQQALHLGYEGLMIESHISPLQALSDANQQLTPSELHELLQSLSFREMGEDSGLDQLRHEIDETDNALWELIAKRMQISQQIGVYKQQHNMSVLQSGRYADIVKKRLAWAEQKGLSEDVVQRILDALHEESCRKQL